MMFLYSETFFSSNREGFMKEIWITKDLAQIPTLKSEVLAVGQIMKSIPAIKVWS
jgi:hypothetical protein